MYKRVPQFSDPERAHEVVQGLAKRVEKAFGLREVVDDKRFLLKEVQQLNN